MQLADAEAATNGSALVDWVCARAAANNSYSRCQFCEWYPLVDLAPAAPVRLAAAECSQQQPRLAWFMCLSPATDALALQHLAYVKAAIVSARLNAPSLAPYVVLVRGILYCNMHSQQRNTLSILYSYNPSLYIPSIADLSRGRGD